MRNLRQLRLACLFLLACDGSHAPPGDGPATTPPATATVALRDGNGIAGPYRVGELQKLTIEVRVSGASPGAHPHRLDVLSPGGTLYAQLPLTILAGPEGEGIGTKDLQVAGTPIETYRQLGAWTVRVSRPGASQPLASAAAEITD